MTVLKLGSTIGHAAGGHRTGNDSTVQMSTAVAAGLRSRAGIEQATTAHPVAAALPRPPGASHAHPAGRREANKPLSPTQNCGPSSGLNREVQWGAVLGRASLNVRLQKKGCI